MRGLKKEREKKNQEPFSKSKNEGLTKEKEKNQEPFNKSKNDGLIIIKERKIILNNVNVYIYLGSVIYLNFV